MTTRKLIKKISLKTLHIPSLNKKVLDTQPSSPNLKQAKTHNVQVATLQAPASREMVESTWAKSKECSTKYKEKIGSG